MNDNRRFWTAFGIGWVCGATTALLLAPSSGPETRRRLHGWGGDAVRRTRHALQRVRHAASEQTHRVGRAIEEGRAAFRRGTGSVAPVQPSSSQTGRPST
jgi:gas vesicle protein